MSETLIALVADVPVSSKDRVSEAFFALGLSGLEERGDGARIQLVAYCDGSLADRIQAEVERSLGRPLANTVSWKRESLGDDWRTRWVESLAPVALTEAWTVVPLVPGHRPLSGGDIGLVPELAFGFGEHATTRMAAREVEAFCRERRGASVLDVGTGSGVLAIVAARSGAGPVTGIDSDARAVAAARRNVRANGAASVRIESTPLADVRSRFDLVVANIDTPTLSRLAPVLCERVAPGGSLVLTGLLTEDEGALTREYQSLGVALHARAAEDDWVLLAAKPTNL